MNTSATEVDESNPVSVSEFLLNQAGKEGCNLYGIIDSARDEDVIRHLFQGDVQYRSLFQGTVMEQSCGLSGFLVECKKESSLFHWMTTQTWGKSCCIFLTSRASFDELFSHFQKFNRVCMEGDKVVLFRYYDPQVLRAWLPGCSRVEIDTFFGAVVTSFLAENENGDAILVYNRNNERMDPGPLLISRYRIVNPDTGNQQNTDGSISKKTLRLH